MIKPILLGLALLSTAALAQDSRSDAFAGIPNVTFKTYTVAGTSPREIRESLNRLRPADTSDGKRYDAYTKWWLRWRWSGNSDGTCDPSSATVEFSATVTLPRLAETPGLTPQVREGWRRYMASLERHEAGHLTHVIARVPEIEAAMRAATCDRIAEVPKEILAELQREDVDYDHDTDHGATQGATYPCTRYCD